MALPPPASSDTTASSGTTIKQDTNPQSGETKVKFDIGAAYMVTIPSEVRLEKMTQTKSLLTKATCP